MVWHISGDATKLQTISYRKCIKNIIYFVGLIIRIIYIII